MRVEHVLMFALVMFVFYHFMCRCNRVEGIDNICTEKMHRLINPNKCIQIEVPKNFQDKSKGYKLGECPNDYDSITKSLTSFPKNTCHYNDESGSLAKSDCCKIQISHSSTKV